MKEAKVVKFDSSEVAAIFGKHLIKEGVIPAGNYSIEIALEDGGVTLTVTKE